VSGRRWAPAFAWLVLIFLLTSLPGGAVPRVGIPNVDKIAHFSLYAVLGLLSARAAATSVVLRVRLALVLLCVAIVGCVDEWHQQFIVGRDEDGFDWLADVSGASVGISIVGLRRLRSQRAS
jgi:VanZ family protein